MTWWNNESTFKYTFYSTKCKTVVQWSVFRRSEGWADAVGGRRAAAWRRRRCWNFFWERLDMLLLDDDNEDDSRLCNCWKELVANYFMCLLVLACFCVNWSRMKNVARKERYLAECTCLSGIVLFLRPFRHIYCTFALKSYIKIWQALFVASRRNFSKILFITPLVGISWVEWWSPKLIFLHFYTSKVPVRA